MRDTSASAEVQVTSGITVEQRSNRSIVRCSGTLDEAGAEELRKVVEPLIVSGDTCTFIPVSLDMAEVDTCTQDATEVLMFLKEKAAGCLDDRPSPHDMLRVVHPSAAVREALNLAGVLSVFTGWRENLCTLPTAASSLSSGVSDSGQTTYYEKLEHVRKAFPSPQPDVYHDAYLAAAMSHGLRAVNSLKTCGPVLGGRAQPDYDAARKARLPEHSGDIESTLDEIAGYFSGMTLWNHELVQPNVIPPASIPSVVASMLGALMNPNIIWDEYSNRVGEAEVEATAMCARLLGYDPERSAGVFTWGGTGTNFYGIRLGIEKAQPDAFRNGIRQDMKLFASDASHYCKLNALGWLGVGTRNLITVPTDADNAMDIDALERVLRETLDNKGRIAGIVATVGTTDSFGLDNVLRIHSLRDALVREYGLEYVPHIHADAVIGWAWTVFNDYNFAANPMRFPERTLRSLWDVRSVVKFLHLADSVGIDFHKTGYTPYLSSLFIVKDKTDLERISRDKELMPYLFQFGNYHPGVFTMESSRGGSGVLSALANLKYLGKDGYRTLLGYIVTIAEALRMRLEKTPWATVLNDHNHGPVTLFRVYPDGLEPSVQYRKELSGDEASLLRHNEYNRRVFNALHERMASGECLQLSLTERYRATEAGTPILALKSYVMTPYVREESMIQLMHCLETVRADVTMPE